MSVEKAKEYIINIVEALCVNGEWSAYDGDWSDGEHDVMGKNYTKGGGFGALTLLKDCLPQAERT